MIIAGLHIARRLSFVSHAINKILAATELKIIASWKRLWRGGWQDGTKVYIKKMGKISPRNMTHVVGQMWESSGIRSKPSMKCSY